MQKLTEEQLNTLLALEPQPENYDRLETLAFSLAALVFIVGVVHTVQYIVNLVNWVIAA